MLTLRRKPGERVFIGDEPLEVTKFDNATITVFFRGTHHTIWQGRMYNLDPEIILCYNERIGNSVKFQIKASPKILRGELYEKRNS